MESPTTPPFWKNETRSVPNWRGKSLCVKYLLLMKGQSPSQVEEDNPRAVSYTHLTLPTKLEV